MAKSKKRHKHHKGGGVAKLPGYSLADMLALRDQLVEEVKDNAKEETQRILADRQAQRVAWAYTISLNELHGFGPKRFKELEAKVAEVLKGYAEDKAENDQDVADEHLRRWVSQIKDAPEAYVHENMPVNQDLSDEVFASIRESDNRIR